MKIGIIGGYPPGFGGVSVHIARLHSYIQEHYPEYLVTVYDLHGKNKRPSNNVVRIVNLPFWLLRYLTYQPEDIIHIHVSNWLLRLILGLCALHRKKQVVTTLHGNGFINACKYHPIRKRMMIRVLCLSERIICVNQSIYDYLTYQGVSSKKLITIPAFLPPSSEEADVKNISPDIQTFIDTHSPILSVNASKLWINNGSEVYGVDMCVDLVHHLTLEYPNIGLLVCLSKYETDSLYSSLLKKIEEYNVKENILIPEENTKFAPILTMSDVFLRPTNTDGDALSIREALYFSIPVIASDVVERPEGCYTFKTRDLDDLVKVTKSVLPLNGTEKRGSSTTGENYAEKIIQIYKTIQ